MRQVFVHRGGPLTTVQDLGRPGYQRFGIPPSGALDEFAFRMANALVGNPDGSAALECTVGGLSLEFKDPMRIAITGGGLDPALDGGPCPMWEEIYVTAGSTLTLRRPKTGCRAYIAFQGGLAVPVVLGSRSTYVGARLGGFRGRRLEAGDVLPVYGGFGPDGGRESFRKLPYSLRPRYEPEVMIRVILGPQDSLFQPETLTAFAVSIYQVTHLADRVGYRLAGPLPCPSSGILDMLSEGTPAGSVQVTGEDSLIVALADRQTVGGYPKIATVVTADIGAFAQLKPGDSVRFRPVGIQEARRASLEMEEKYREACCSLARGNRP